MLILYMREQDWHEMKEFIPHDMILKAQVFKYKYLAVPGAVIILSFFLRGFFEESRWIPIIALVVYFLLLCLFRFRRVYPDHEAGAVVAPINGKITNIDALATGNVLTIQKPFFESSEITTCTKTDIINRLDTEGERVSWQIECANSKVFYTENPDYQAVLIGIAAGNAKCEVFIPAKYDLFVEIGSVVDAGITMIAGNGEKEVGDESKDSDD